MALLRFTSRNFITDRWFKDHPNEKIECWGCGKLIDQLDPRQKYCDNRCKKRYWRSVHKTITYKNCEWCNVEFIAAKSDKVYCSKRCIMSAGRKRRGIPVLAETVRSCRNCHNKFMPRAVAQKYCSFWCFYRMQLYKKLLYHRRTRGTNKPIDKKAVLGITDEELQQSLKNIMKAREYQSLDSAQWKS